MIRTGFYKCCKTANNPADFQNTKYETLFKFYSSFDFYAAVGSDENNPGSLAGHGTGGSDFLSLPGGPIGVGGRESLPLPGGPGGGMKGGDRANAAAMQTPMKTKTAKNFMSAYEG